RPEEYLLNVAVQSADFFDLSYMPDVNKIIVTALWTQDERIQYENRGFLFSVLEGGLCLVRYDEEGKSSSLTSNLEIPDHSEKVSISATTTDDNFSTLVPGTEENDDEILIIKGEKNLAELVQTVRGKYEDDKSVQHISGNKLDIEQVAYRIAANVD